MATQSLPSDYSSTTIAPPSQLAIESLPPMLRLDERERGFVKALAAKPDDKSKACVAAGYHKLAYRWLLKKRLVLEALQDECRRLIASYKTADDVISDAYAVIRDTNSSDMAKARCLELVADLKGLRDRKPEPQAITQTLSATFAPAVPLLPGAAATLAALTAGLPDEE